MSTYLQLIFEYGRYFCIDPDKQEVVVSGQLSGKDVFNIPSDTYPLDYFEGAYYLNGIKLCDDVE